jgi:small subunit ribosomal protein S6
VVRLERAYEGLYIIRPDIEEDGYAQIISRYEQAVQEQGGSVTEVNEWGMRPFAYEIERYDKGYYVLMTFTIDAEGLPRLEEWFKLDQAVLRHQIVRLEKPAQECAPSRTTA